MKNQNISDLDIIMSVYPDMSEQDALEMVNNIRHYEQSTLTTF